MGTTDMDATTPRPRRRWLQFSLRSMLVLTTFVAILIAWVGPRYYTAREQRQAVKAILASGGKVGYDYGWRHCWTSQQWHSQFQRSKDAISVDRFPVHFDWHLSVLSRRA